MRTMPGDRQCTLTGDPLSCASLFRLPIRCAMPAHRAQSFCQPPGDPNGGPLKSCGNFARVHGPDISAHVAGGLQGLTGLAFPGALPTMHAAGHNRRQTDLHNWLHTLLFASSFWWQGLPATKTSSEGRWKGHPPALVAP